MLETILDTPKISLNPDDNLAAILEMSEEFRALLLSDTVFRMVTIESAMAQKSLLMSCGGLLSRLHRLQQQRGQLTPGQRQVLDIAQERADQTTQDLREPFHNILDQEAKIRLDYFEWFLRAGKKDSTFFCDEYAIEMRNRQRLEEIIKALGNDVDVDVADDLAKLDGTLKVLCCPGAFIWEAELEPIYPADRYWFLYLEPKAIQSAAVDE